ncbi:MAG: hypothetical protein ABIS29_14235 [Vicinamibacterales bacterium]
MANEMTRQEFAEYMIGFEERLNSRFAQIDQRFGQIDLRLGQVDHLFGEIDLRFGQIDQRFGQIDQRFGQMDQHFAQIDLHFVQVDQQFDDLTQRMTVQFEDVRREIRFSLEAVTGLREATDRGFDDMRRDHASQTSLLEAAIRHVRHRVDIVERPHKPR